MLKTCSVRLKLICVTIRMSNRSFKLTLDELAVLGDKKNVVEYVAERLEFDFDTTRCIMERHSAVMRVRVTKVTNQ